MTSSKITRSGTPRRFPNYAILSLAPLLLLLRPLAGLIVVLTAAATALVDQFRAFYLVVSLIVFTALFAALFKYVPDIGIPWRSVCVGAFVTAVLFTAGTFLIGFYLGRATVASAYGAAGSLVLLLIWLY